MCAKAKGQTELGAGCFVPGRAGGECAISTPFYSDKAVSDLKRMKTNMDKKTTV